LHWAKEISRGAAKDAKNETVLNLGSFFANFGKASHKLFNNPTNTIFYQCHIKVNQNSQPQIGQAKIG